VDWRHPATRADQGGIGGRLVDLALFRFAVADDRERVVILPLVSGRQGHPQRFGSPHPEGARRAIDARRQAPGRVPLSDHVGIFAQVHERFHGPAFESGFGQGAVQDRRGMAFA